MRRAVEPPPRTGREPAPRTPCNNLGHVTSDLPAARSDETALDPAAWPAPTRTGATAGSPLDATVAVPGSKSLTNRLLVLAALADGPGVLRGALRSRDTDLMAARTARPGRGHHRG